MPVPISGLGIEMPTRNTALTDHQTALIEQLVESGRYQNASEVLREGFRLLEVHESRTGETARCVGADLIPDVPAGILFRFDQAYAR